MNRYLYWGTFALSVFVLQLNIGLGIIVMIWAIIPVLILHAIVGLRLNKIEQRKDLLTISSLNLLAFSLIRPDGVHAFTDNGLSSLLWIFGVDGGYNRGYENYFFWGSVVLLVGQVVIELILRKEWRR